MSATEVRLFSHSSLVELSARRTMQLRVARRYESGQPSYPAHPNRALVVQLPDVVTLPTKEVIQLQKAGILARYEPLEAKDYPRELRNPYFTVYLLKPYGLVYNKSLLGKDAVPRKYSELSSETWKGRLVLIDPLRNEGVLNWFACMLEVLGASMLKRVYRQASQQVGGFEEGLDRVLKGESWAAFPMRLSKTVLNNSSLGFALLPPVFAETDAIAVLEKGASPNSARLFMNFMLSEQGQLLLSEQGYVPTRKGISSPVDLTGVELILDLEECDARRAREEASKLCTGG